MIYYVTSDQITPGQVLCFAATDWTHETIIVHPDSLDQARKRLSCFRLVPLREAPDKISPPKIPYTSYTPPPADPLP